MDNQTFLLFYAAKILKEYCENFVGSCDTCPFYIEDNSERIGCMFGSDVPVEWDIPESEEKGI